MSNNEIVKIGIRFNPFFLRLNLFDFIGNIVSSCTDRLYDPFTPVALPATRIFFLTEQHYNERDLRKNTLFLKTNFSSERNDIILVEDDATTPSHLLNREQLRGFTLDNNNIEGWDCHESCVKRKKLAHSFEIIETTAQRVKSGKPLENDLDYLMKVAKKVELKILPLLQKASPNLSPVKDQLAGACLNYVTQARKRVSFQYFSVRQKSLINTVKKALASRVGRGNQSENKEAISESEGLPRIFVLVGKDHVNPQNPAVKQFAEELFSSLKGISYQII